MTDWTDRSRPVLDNYRDWLAWYAALDRQMTVDEWKATVRLMCDLAAALRTGAEMEHALDVYATDPHAGSAESILADWQRCARDPETGERVFP